MLSSALTPSSLNPNSHCLDQPYRIRPLLLMIAMHPPLLIPPLLHQVIDIPLWFASAASCTSSVHVSNSMVRAPCLRCASLCCPKTYPSSSSAFTRLLLSVGASLTVSGSFCACVAPLVYKQCSVMALVHCLNVCCRVSLHAHVCLYFSNRMCRQLVLTMYTIPLFIYEFATTHLDETSCVLRRCCVSVDLLESSVCCA